MAMLWRAFSCCAPQNGPMDIVEVVPSLAGDLSPRGTNTDSNDVTGIPVEWEVVLERGDDASRGRPELWAIHFRAEATHVVIQSTDCTMIKRWNQNFPEQAVKPGAVILACNGIVGDGEAMLNSMCASRRSKLKILYVPDFVITIWKDGPLGCDCKRTSMEVTRLSDEGAIPAYNQSCSPGYEVIVGDRLCSVHKDLSGDARHTARSIAGTHGKLTLRICRAL